MVRLGTETEVAAFGRDWYPLVHYHPNPTGALTFRLPSQMDFDGMYTGMPALVRCVSSSSSTFPASAAAEPSSASTWLHPSRSMSASTIRTATSRPSASATRATMRPIGASGRSMSNRLADPQAMLDDIGQWIRDGAAQAASLRRPKARAARWRGLPDGIRRTRRPPNATSRATAVSSMRCWAQAPAAVPALSEPPTSAVVDAAKARFDANQAQPGDLGIIIDKATADMRAVIDLSEGGLGPAACADYCNLAARGCGPDLDPRLAREQQSVCPGRCDFGPGAREELPRPSDRLWPRISSASFVRRASHASPTRPSHSSSRLVLRT